jgi:hypothetical protein
VRSYGVLQFSSGLCVQAMVLRGVRGETVYLYDMISVLIIGLAMTLHVLVSYDTVSVKGIINVS